MDGQRRDQDGLALLTNASALRVVPITHSYMRQPLP
jgi:hypothetical protein